MRASDISALAFAIVALLILYAAFVIGLLIAGRRSDARAWAGLIPDCVVLLRRLLSDPRVPRSRRWLLWGLVGYLLLPVDLVPDFIPVAGQVDDAILVALALRSVVRAAGPEAVREHWPGPAGSVEVLLRLAGVGRNTA